DMTGAWGGAACTEIVTDVTPGIARSAALHCCLMASAAAGASVVSASRNDTFPPPTARSLMKPKETMSREKPGDFTCLSASRTDCSFSVVVVTLAPSRNERISQTCEREVRRKEALVRGEARGSRAEPSP